MRDCWNCHMRQDLNHTLGRVKKMLTQTFKRLLGGGFL